jgi:hypothetical protein
MGSVADRDRFKIAVRGPEMPVHEAFGPHTAIQDRRGRINVKHARWLDRAGSEFS